MTIRLPAQGTPWPDLQNRMRAATAGEYDWRHGRATRNAWIATPEVRRVAEAASLAHVWDNGLYTAVFHGLRQFQTEVVAMAAGLLGAPEPSAGVLTSGGTESIFQACLAAREWARQRPGGLPARPLLVIPRSAHPAFNKAAFYLGLAVVRVPVSRDFRADVAAMADAIDPDTIMIVGSAPCWPYGVIDPIPALGDLARKTGVWLHVDACVGGFFFPFARRAGHQVSPCDLSVPGVASLSADLHKYGFAAKGASVVLFADLARKAGVRFAFDDWPTGSYLSESFSGTRSGGPVAAAWAVMNFLGEDGYTALARTSLDTAAKLVAAVEDIRDLRLVARPDLAVVAFDSPSLDIFAVAEAMERRGWTVSRIKEPPAIHLVINPVHAPVIDAYIADLRAATAEVAASGAEADNRDVTYAG